MAYDRENIFAKILRGEIPCDKVHEDDYVLAFKDINPRKAIHVLVIPKGEYVSFDDFSATASDAEIVGFTRAVAQEVAGIGITVNAVCPGFVDTDLTSKSMRNIVARTGMSEKEARIALEKMSPQARLITPEEVADLVVMLASDSAFGINGQAINLDGGAVAS